MARQRATARIDLGMLMNEYRHMCENDEAMPPPGCPQPDEFDVLIRKNVSDPVVSFLVLHWSYFFNARKVTGTPTAVWGAAMSMVLVAFRLRELSRDWKWESVTLVERDPRPRS